MLKIRDLTAAVLIILVSIGSLPLTPLFAYARTPAANSLGVEPVAGLPVGSFWTTVGSEHQTGRGTGNYTGTLDAFYNYTRKYTLVGGGRENEIVLSWDATDSWSKVANGKSWIFHNNGTFSRGTLRQLINLTINVADRPYTLVQSSSPLWRPYILFPSQWFVEPTALHIGNLVNNPWQTIDNSGGVVVTNVQWTVDSFDSLGFKNGIIPVGTLSYTGTRAAGPSAGGALTLGTKTVKNFFDKTYGLSVGLSWRGNYSYTSTEGTVTETSEGKMNIAETNVNLVWSTLFSTLDTLPSIGNYRCTYHDFPFNAREGQVVILTVKSDPAVFAYMVTDSDYAYWTLNYQCGIPSYLAGSLTATLTYSADAIVPKDGVYHILVVNFNRVPAYLKIESYLSPTNATILATTLSSAASSETSQSLSGNQAQSNTIGLVGSISVIAIVAVVASVLVFRKRRRTPTASTITLERETARTVRASPQLSQLSIPTGYGELDRMLGGGIPLGYAVVLVSQSYDERDLLVRKTIDSSVAAGMPTVYLSDDIAKTRDLISRHNRNFYALNPMADKIAPESTNLFKIPDIGDLSSLSITSNKIIESKVADAKNKVIIIDFLSDLLVRNKALTTRKWLSDFAAKRKAGGFTILATLDPSIGQKEEIQTIVGLFDGVLEVYEKPLQERARRFLVIKKMYARDYSENELMLDKQKLLS